MARLSARWTHFFAKGKVFKHFWQSTEVVSTDASASGSILANNASLVPGFASGGATTSGALLSVDAEIVPGVATGDAVAPGALLIADVSLLPGVASGITEPLRFGGGTVAKFGRNAVAPGAVIEVAVTLVPGGASTGPDEWTDEDDFDLLDGML